MLDTTMMAALRFVPVAPKLRMAWLAWALAFAYLPSLTFFGHWDLRFDIPGTNSYIGLPGPPATHDHSGHSHAPGAPEDHAEHCHAGPAECGDTPVTSSATVATLGRSIEIETEAHSLAVVLAEASGPLSHAAHAPEPPPPRTAFDG